MLPAVCPVSFSALWGYAGAIVPWPQSIQWIGVSFTIIGAATIEQPKENIAAF